MLPVESVTASPSSVKHMQYAYLEHLHLYKTPAEMAENTRLKKQLAKQAEPSFLDRVEREYLQYPSMKERSFLQKRNEFHRNEELLQQMNYTNGLHYSQLHNIEHILDEK